MKNLIKRVGLLVERNESLRLRIQIILDWWGTKVWKRTTEGITPQGFRLISGFHPAYKAMRNGQFEIEETLLLYKLLGKIDIFVDIGANLGYYVCIALQKDKKVIAFEPQPQNLSCLFQNLIANGWQDCVEIFPVALSEKAGLLTLYGASGPSASLIKNWSGYSSRYKQIVPVSTLDIVLSGRFIDNPILIKIDVEGAEFQVLKGSLNIISRNPKPVWIVEVCLNEFHPQGLNPFYRDIFGLFSENGYSAYTASGTPKLVSKNDIDQWVIAKAADSGTNNYLFVDQSIDIHELIS